MSRPDSLLNDPFICVAGGYEPYSKEDTGVGRGDRTPEQQNPLNPYRYTADRLDSGNGGMWLGTGGTRIFSPDFKRFYQRDHYAGVRQDQGLNAHAWSFNRYALASGYLKGARSLSASGGPSIDVVESSQDGTGPHLAACGRAARGEQWRLECQAAVWPLGVVVGHVLLEHGSQVPLIQDEHVVQALVSEGAHHALCNGVGNRFQLHAMGTVVADFVSFTPITR